MFIACIIGATGSASQSAAAEIGNIMIEWLSIFIAAAAGGKKGLEDGAKAVAAIRSTTCCILTQICVAVLSG